MSTWQFWLGLGIGIVAGWVSLSLWCLIQFSRRQSEPEIEDGTGYWKKLNEELGHEQRIN